jgi:tetratricopeptide (TPR) repeat protein
MEDFMKFRNLAAAVAGMVFLAAAAAAQTAKIEGDVDGFDGKPLPGAVVKLHRTDISQDFQTKTDKKGHFIYMGLQPGGTFKVTIVVDGKDVDSKPGYASINEQDPLKFDLAKSKAAKDMQNAALNKAIEAGGQVTKEMESGLTPEQKDALEKKLKDDAESIKKHKDLNDAYTAGLTAMDSKNYPAAIESFEKASTLDAKQTAIWVNLADAYLADAATKKGADRDAETQKGMDGYGKAIELKPDDAALHNNYGRALANAQKYPEAMAEMSKAAQIDPPGAGKYYYNLGAILVNIGQTDPAAEAFQKSIAADPNYADAYYQYGVSLMAKAKIGDDGKVTPAPGTVEAFQKCLSFGDKCTFAQQCNDSIAALGASIDTKYSDPNAKTTTKKKK